MVIDIDCSRHGKPPNEKLIAELAAECRMPLCYGGGIRTITQIEKLIALGVEKVAISSAAVESKELIGLAAERVGRQSIVGVIDIKRTGMFRKLEVVTYNGTRRTGLDPIAHAIAIEELGVGEIVINSVDHDGMMDGYDLELTEKVREKTSVPLTVLGGAGSMDHVRALVDRFPIIGAAAGSLFVFKGKLKGVLINYPPIAERDALNFRN